VKLRFTRNPKKSGGRLRAEGTLGKVYQFMSEHRNEYAIREKDVSFRDQQQRLLQRGEEGVRGAEQSRCGTDSPNTRAASLSVREPPCEGSPETGLREAGEP
jgi:hypothetical protein